MIVFYKELSVELLNYHSVEISMDSIVSLVSEEKQIIEDTDTTAAVTMTVV